MRHAAGLKQKQRSTCLAAEHWRAHMRQHASSKVSAHRNKTAGEHGPRAGCAHMRDAGELERAQQRGGDGVGVAGRRGSRWRRSEMTRAELCSMRSDARVEACRDAEGGAM